MNLPTAQNYVIQNLIHSLVSLEANFLKPNVLLKFLNKTELAMAEIVEILSKEELTHEFLEKEKENKLITNNTVFMVFVICIDIGIFHFF